MVFMLRWGGLTKVSRNSLGIYVSIREFATLGLLRGSWSLEQIGVRTKGKKRGPLVDGAHHLELLE